MANFPPTEQHADVVWPLGVQHDDMVWPFTEQQADVVWPLLEQSIDVTWPLGAALPGAPVVVSAILDDLVVVAGDAVTVAVVYTGDEPVTLSYAWTLNGVSVGVDSDTYTPVAAGTLRCAVTATNIVGVNTRISAPAHVYITPVATSDIVEPAVTTGGTLTANVSATGTPPITFAYQWVRTFTDIPGATAPTYITQPGDGGQVVQVRVTPTGPATTGVAVTSTPRTVYDPPIVTFVNLSLSTAAVGTVLSASATITGTFPITTAWRWLRNGVAISGETTSTYTLVTADIGTSITAEATGIGVTATSAPTVSAPCTVTSGQLHALRRAGLADDTLQTAAATPASSTMTFLIWIDAITAHDALVPTLLGWGAPSSTGVVDPGVLIRFDPANNDRLNVFVGRAGTSGSTPATVALPGGAIDITGIAPFLVWVTINGTILRMGTGDPAAGNVAGPIAITGGVDTTSTTVATVFGRLGSTTRGCAGTLAVGVVGEVLSDAAIAAVAASGISGPAAAVAASSAKLWAPRPVAGVASGVDLVTSPTPNIEDAAGVHTAVFTVGTARLKAA